MSLAKRLKQARQAKKLSLQQLGEMAGVSYQNIQNIEGGKVLQPRKLDKIAEVLEVPTEYLMFGKGPLDRNNEDYHVQLLDVSASAGNGLMMFEENAIKSISVDRKRFKELFRKEPTYSMKIINAKGDSMAPTFKDNDFLLVDTANTELTDGVFVFRIGEELYVKRLQRLPNKVLALSDNDKYQPFDMPKEAVIIAKVIDAWRHEFI